MYCIGDKCALSLFYTYLRGGLTGVGEVVGARRGEGGEGGGVSNGGWGEASSLRRFSASKSHGGDGGWSPNRKSSGRSPQPHSGNQGLGGGAEEATLWGLDEMANCTPQWVGDERVGAGAGPTQMFGSETQRSRPKTRFLASRGRLITKECPPHVNPTPYQVALEAVEEALMCTAMPPPSPPQPPKYVPKDPPTLQNTTVHGPYSAKTLQLIWENHGGGVQYFVDGVLNRRAMYRFAVQQPKKNPLRVWQEGMRIRHSHFLNRDEEDAAVVLEILCATPKPPRIPKPGPPPVPRRPLPPPPSDQVTLTQYSRHRRTSLLPLAPAPKRPCPTPQYGSLLQRRASHSAPPLMRP